MRRASKGVKKQAYDHRITRHDSHPAYFEGEGAFKLRVNVHSAFARTTDGAGFFDKIGSRVSH